MSMKTVREVRHYLDNIHDDNHEGVRFLKRLVNEYMDGIISFGEMLDGIKTHEGISIGLKFDGVMCLGFSLDEARKMLLL